ncbi:MAG TPA: helix-turn-helix domain-containing protein, partial [Actinomycetota bacterium]|nr:helix-turn-helix domain-containing protein [Actinomycetota bacterium]
MASRVMDLTGAGPRIGVAIQSSLPIEFMLSIMKFEMTSSQGTFEDGETWFDEVRTKASPELLQALGSFTGKEGAWISLGLALQTPPPQTVPDFIEQIGSLPAQDLWLALAGYHLPPLRDDLGPEAFLRAAAGDPEARRAMVRAARKYEDDIEETPLLTMTPEEARDRALLVMRLWHEEVFASEANAIADVLERDAAAKRILAATTTSQKLIELATNGIEFRGERWVRRVVLVPHVVMRPWNVSSAWEDQYILCYPVADESLESDRAAPPARMLRLYKALSDEKRLRILKRLVTGSATLQELADTVGLAKSSTHHHMVILRSAGL